MKRMFILAAALLAALAISAQEPNKFGLKKTDSPRSGKYELPDSLRNKFELPDSLAHLSPWKPDYRAEGKMKVKPSVSMTSVVVIQKENLPSRVTVIDNNTLRLGTPLHPFERSGVEQESVPRCVPRRTDDLLPDAPISGVCGCASDAFLTAFPAVLQGYLSEYGREAARLPVLPSDAAIRHRGA